MQITRSNIRPHDWWSGLSSGDCMWLHLIYLGGLWGHVWVDTLTLSPPRILMSQVIQLSFAAGCNVYQRVEILQLFTHHSEQQDYDLSHQGWCWNLYHVSLSISPGNYWGYNPENNQGPGIININAEPYWYNIWHESRNFWKFHYSGNPLNNMYKTPTP